MSDNLIDSAQVEPPSASNETEADSPPVIDIGPRCRHLRTKKMYILDDFDDDGQGDDDDAVYWCGRNYMRTFGPDDDLVSLPLCRDRQRSCYQPM